MMTETHAVKCELAADVLRSYGTLQLQVTGRSMFPAVRPGDVLVVNRIRGSAVAQGDIVVFARNRMLLAHRVVASNGPAGSWLLTQGDATPAPDAPVHENEVLGKVATIVRGGKHILPRETSRRVERWIGNLIHRSRVAARIIVGIHGVLQASQIQPK
jgi:signal peptidase I